MTTSGNRLPPSYRPENSQLFLSRTVPHRAARFMSAGYRDRLPSPDLGYTSRAVRLATLPFEMATMNEPNFPLVLRAREAARALNISTRHLHTLTKSGVVPHVRIGHGKRKIVLYSVDSLKVWLAQQTQVSKEGGEQ